MSEPPPPPTPDELNRLWQHGLHEERLFHDRLNYFSVLEMGLLSICGIMYNKEPAVGFFLPLTAVALLFSLLWLVIQTRHWRYCELVHQRIAELIPEYRATIIRFGRGTGWSLSKPLALAVPTLFAGTWVAFLGWLLVRGNPAPPTEPVLTAERVAIGVLAAAVVYLMFRVRRVERRVRQQTPPP
ncbi:MAG: hypothetical protein K2X82_22860 [Gemmataceae bacterium]|nr:hypothetical protein [Gemmataceae bacterium]